MGFTNQVRLADILCPFNSHDRDRERALVNAKRALRRRVKKFIDVKKTIVIIAPIIEQIDRINKDKEDRHI